NRLTVAVWIDGQLTPQQSASVRNAVASTVGFNEARGDQISVESMQFERAAAAAAFPEQKPWPAWLPWAVAAAVAAVGAGVGGFLWMRQRKLEELRKKAAEEAQKAILPPLLEQPEEAKRALTPEEQEKQRIERQVARLANERTEEFVQLLKTWLMEEER
ncbi:MAG: flagellar M-ring protein FliF C-terminal domain-containing protein, partial [Bacillota bacterium]|nr:flagellar M-ring protein FliF C-terminal domain-containing protein [Bacillota bacterium]